MKSDQFLNYGIEIVHLSNELLDGWILFNRDNNPYLLKSTRIEKKSQLLLIEYYVTYSLSYEVPILSFNAYYDDGSIVDINDAWKLFDFDPSNWHTCLTQTEHLVLKTPFLTLHPCETKEFIAANFSQSKNPLISWLSAVGPIIGLHLPNEYYSLTDK